MNNVISKSSKSIIISVIAILSVPIISGCLVVSRLLSQTAESQTPFVQTELPEDSDSTPKFEPIPRPAGLLGDGGLIAYEAYDGSSYSKTLFVNPDGSGEPTVEWDVYHTLLNWSSDGKIFVGLFGPSSAASPIFSIKADGTDYVRITDVTQADDHQMQMDYYTNVQISPDGKYLAYSHSRFSSSSKCDAGPLIVIRINGSDRRLVSNTNCNNDYDWSIDSSRLVLSASEDPANYSQLFIFDLRTGFLTELTSKVDAQFDLSAHWLPDGSTIFFLRKGDHPGTSTGTLINSDGSNIKECSIVICQSWSPDGSKLAYVGEGFQLYIADNDGSNSTKISHFDSIFWVWGMRWSPDGKYLVMNMSDASTGYNDVYVISADGKSYWPIANNQDYEKFVIGWLP